ncbi:diguanylate cyclase [Curvibacter sp. APW13]|uniref:diguanylate cyclase domain-containing protein n=1 Tax=Curvibacter sp. APW13 TaxID=3077236 RepID=UPI0028DD86F1|nr:diguanylate cyclase [Curvibacter sp. APW13]MDT8991056.1 diguanylate cyclase [Curvibacter sp. APW13]
MIHQEWDTGTDVKNYLLRLIERGYVVIAVVAAAASSSRAFITGWQSLYTIHLLLAGMVIALYYCPHRIIPALPRIYFVVLVPGIIGIAGLYTFGFYSNGLAWTIVACAMAAVFLPLRSLIAYLAGMWLSILSIGLLFIQHRLQLPVNGGTYIHQPLGWMPIFVGSLVIMLIVTTVVFGYKRAIETLLRTTLEQRDIIQHRAAHDPLTALPNKGVADDRLAMACERAKREGEKAALLFLDLDGFKHINDTLGHQAGDRVLATVAQRLQGGIRKVDTAARLGGDEFLVVLDGLGSAEHAKTVAAKLIESVGAPVDIEGKACHIGVSIGIALYPDDSKQPSDLVRLADAAMYAVKRAGKNACMTVSEARKAETAGPHI